MSIRAWRALRLLRGTLEDGTKVYSGTWHMPRPDDPRHFVIVEPAEGKTLVYWGTPQVKDALAATEWPQLYRERNEIQENGFKRMIDHGALNINYGRKTILGPDRHQQRAREKLDQSLMAASSGSTRRPRRSRHTRSKWPSPCPKGMANAWSSVSAPWQGWKRSASRPGPPRQTRCASLSLGATQGAGRSRLSQADDHDRSHAAARERADVVHGRARGAPHHAGEPGLSLAHPLCA